MKPLFTVTFLLIMFGILPGCTTAAFVAGAGAGAAIGASQERSPQRTLSDEKIEIRISEKLFRQNVKTFSEVSVISYEERVLLTGLVDSADSRAQAVRLAYEVGGVREVINEMEVGGEKNLWDGAQDAWISTQLRSKLLVDKKISSFNYAVTTANHSVYLMGVAQTRVELDRVLAHARDISGVKRVVSYVLLKDDPARFN